MAEKGSKLEKRPETNKNLSHPENPVNLYPMECEAYSTGAVQKNSIDSGYFSLININNS
jgi:hypothetical protein